MKITCYKDLFDSKGVAFHIDVQKAFSRIKSGTSREILEAIRTESDKEKRNELKKKLPCFLFSGIFKQRNDNSLQEHSGLICLDFDGFPNAEELALWRNSIESDRYTMAVFTSPSGNGLKVIVKIPTCDKDEHKLYFKALQSHYDCDYFDISCKNVSRVCYESYDPNIFINLDSEKWTAKFEEDGYNYAERVPNVVLTNSNDIVRRLLIWWNREFGLIEGNRNNNLFVLAKAFNDYGVDQVTAETTIIHDIVQGSMKDEEIFTLVRSAYRDTASFNTKYFEDRQTYRKVELQLKRGIDPTKIKETIKGVSDELIAEVQNRFKEMVFWTIKESKGKKVVNIDNIKYKLFLEDNGFFKYYPEKSDIPVLVYKESNIVRTTSEAIIKDYVLNYLMEKGEYEVWSMLASSFMYFSEKYLSMLDSIHLKMLEDTKDKCFLYFKDSVVEVMPNEIKVNDYVDVNGYIWADQIINRNFNQTTNFKNDFQSFIHRISADDKKRIQSMETTIGYLLHSFKDKTHQKSIIFNDEEINDDPNGGSGKSLVLNAIASFKKLVKIDGKDYDPNKGQFTYQRISIDTQVLAFDDVRKNFNFESLFSLITEGISVNKKNKDEIYIPFERSPKIVITTNYVINGAGASHDRRRHEVEFHQYFNQHRTPLTEYGKLFFDQWNEDEWTRFDNYMISCIQKFLSFGLMSTDSINANTKRFIQNTSKDFFDWIEEGNLGLDQNIYPAELIVEYKKEFKDAEKWLTNKKFVQWIRKYCDFKGYEYESIRHPRRGAYIKTKQNKETLDGKELPF